MSILLRTVNIEKIWSGFTGTDFSEADSEKEKYCTGPIAFLYRKHIVDTTGTWVDGSTSIYDAAERT